MMGKQMLCSTAAATSSTLAVVFLMCAGCSSSGSSTGAPGAGGAADTGNTGGTANPTANGGTPNGVASGGSTVSGNGGTPGGTASGGTATVTGNGGTGNVTASGGTGTASGGAGTVGKDAGGKCPANCEFLSAECFCQPGALFAPITDWASAQKICQTVGLNLATIHNKAESDAIGAVLTGKGLSGQNSSIWIGLSDQAVQDKWEWVSGAPFSFTAWLPGQPNNSPLGGPGGEHCVVVQASGQWDDFPCGQNVGFVCN